MPKEIKIKRKEFLKKESLSFRLFVFVGIIQYKMLYDKNRTNPWGYRYRLVWFNPLTWLIMIPVIIIGLIRTLYETIIEIPKEFKWKVYR
jgi:hypothetical protein